MAGCISAADAWKKLEDKFNRKNITSVTHLLRQLFTLQHDSSIPINEFLTEFKQTWDRLWNRYVNGGSSDDIALSYKSMTESDYSKVALFIIAIATS